MAPEIAKAGIGSAGEWKSMNQGSDVGRKHLHRRAVQMDGYLRDDGLWDLEAELKDTRSYPSEGYERGELAPGDPVHHICVRLTVDHDLLVKNAAFEMKSIPFGHCQGAAANPQALVGMTLGRGWRRTVDERMKGVQGCSHLRELLYTLPTLAMQTLTPYREAHMPELGAPRGADGAPFYLNQCRSWSFESPVVAKLYPQFARSAKRPPSGGE
jgi:hypothetical protein